MRKQKIDRGLQVAWGIWGMTILMLMVSLGCTKPRDLDTSIRAANRSEDNKFIAKSLIDPDAKYLYLPSSLNSTRTTGATFPMYMGEAKIVKLQMTEKSLKVIEIDPEDQFSGNPVNNKPVLTIPLTHVDYRCAPDADGKCTHKEEEDAGKPWDKRRYAKINSAELAVQEINFLPVVLANLFATCHEEIDSAFDNINIDEDSINIGIEKTYKSRLGLSEAGSRCNVEIKGGLSDLTFRVLYQYSLVKLDKLTSPNYKPVTYSPKEKSTFGFFDTETLKLDRDNNANETGKKVFLNRWNPAKKSVVYHLSPNFNKPEYAAIKAETFRAVANINHSLKAAGADMQIDLQGALPDMNPGDLRVNSIVMVEEPVNYGILGYGPTAANPLTGEIVHGRTAMYLGVMKTGLKRTYEDLVKDYNEKKADLNARATEIKFDPQFLQENKIRIDQINSLAERIAHPKQDVNRGVSRRLASVNRSEIKPIQDLAKLQKGAMKLKERRLSLNMLAEHPDDESLREQFFSTNCFYSTDFFSIDAAVEASVEKVIEEVGAKPWLELTDSEKDKVVNTLLPFVWGPVLIHELGHNLGLRHNFGGSEDKENFYSDKELEEMGTKRKFVYSSIMDYGYRTTNELQVMGKYDIAALRFGYKNELETADEQGQPTGQYVSLEDWRKNPATKIRDYRYCTDEHVDVNPGCKRFDEGTSLTEVAQHWVRMHDESYLRRNFRNGLESFSLFDDATQVSKLSLIFRSLRANFERYEDIKKTYGLDDNAAEWQSAEFLKDLKQATQIAARFFIKVMQTPDTLCALAKATDLNTIVAVVPLRLITTNAISCSDKENVRLNPAFAVVGQAGKSFQSLKDPHSDNAYMDQVDVRGIWIDKLMAAEALTNRLTGISSFDEFTDNYLDMADMRDEVQKALSGLLLDEVVAPIEIKTTSGQTLATEVPVQLYNVKARMNGHNILAPLHGGVKRAFGIPNVGIDFQAKLAGILKQNLPSGAQESDATSLMNATAALSGLPDGSELTGYKTTDIGLKRIYVNRKSTVSLQMVDDHIAVKVLSQLKAEKIAEIAQAVMENKPLAEEATDTEKAAYALGIETLARFLNGDLQDKSFYERMLGALSD